MRSINQRELRNDSGSVLRQVQAGETVIVTRNGTPMAELRPLPRPRFVPREAIAAAARSAPGLDADQVEADLDRAADRTADRTADG